MISCSHWGMFDAGIKILMIPAGFKLSSRQDPKEMLKPGGIIRIERAQPQIT